MGKWKQRLIKMRRAKKEGCIFGDVGAVGLESGKTTDQELLVLVGRGSDA